jgi:hypothetical protein
MVAMVASLGAVLPGPVLGQCRIQQILRVSAPSAVQSGEAIAIEVRYDATDPNLSGLGLRLHFDSSQVAYQGLSQVLQEGTTFLGAQGPEPDTEDLDGDSATDQFVLTAWADLSAPNDWPGSVPVLLYSASFTANGEFSGIVLNVSGTPAAGAELVGPGLEAGEVLLCDDFESGTTGLWKVRQSDGG